MITYIVLALYLIVAFVIHCGIMGEYRKDMSGELDTWSPTFIHIALVGASLLWPVLVIASLYKKIKGE